MATKEEEVPLDAERLDAEKLAHKELRMIVRAFKRGVSPHTEAEIFALIKAFFGEYGYKCSLARRFVRLLPRYSDLINASFYKWSKLSSLIVMGRYEQYRKIMGDTKYFMHLDDLDSSGRHELDMSAFDCDDETKDPEQQHKNDLYKVAVAFHALIGVSTNADTSNVWYGMLEENEPEVLRTPENLDDVIATTVIARASLEGVSTMTSELFPLCQKVIFMSLGMLRDEMNDAKMKLEDSRWESPHQAEYNAALKQHEQDVMGSWKEYVEFMTPTPECH